MFFVCMNALISATKVARDIKFDTKVPVYLMQINVFLIVAATPTAPFK